MQMLRMNPNMMGLAYVSLRVHLLGFLNGVLEFGDYISQCATGCVCLSWLCPAVGTLLEQCWSFIQWHVEL